MISADQAREALDRMLASETFVNADRLSRFLRFGAEKSLAGQANDVKEYSVGSEVFDRGADFDPRLDPIVRVEARRLRVKIEEYYDGPGRGDAVRITMPKGGYVPVFEEVKPVVAMAAAVTVAPRSDMSRWWFVAALVAVLVIGAFTWPYGTAAGDSTSIAVLPADSTGDQEYTDGLAQVLSVELSHDPRWRVVAWPLVSAYRVQPGARIDALQAADALKVTQVLQIFSQNREGKRRITGILMEPGKPYKLWANTYVRELPNEFATQREVAQSMVQELHKVKKEPRP